MTKTPSEHATPRPPSGAAPSPLTVAAGARLHPHHATPTSAPAGHRDSAAPAAKAVVAESVTGAQSLVRSLESLGVEVMFGIPGGAILPAYDPIFDSTVRHILVRYEQVAGHAATGYAHATGKVGVCMATSAPGPPNLRTP